MVLQIFGGVQPPQLGERFLPGGGHLGPTAPQLDEQQGELLQL